VINDTDVSFADDIDEDEGDVNIVTTGQQRQPAERPVNVAERLQLGQVIRYKAIIRIKL